MGMMSRGFGGSQCAQLPCPRSIPNRSVVCLGVAMGQEFDDEYRPGMNTDMLAARDLQYHTSRLD